MSPAMMVLARREILRRHPKTARDFKKTGLRTLKLGARHSGFRGAFVSTLPILFLLSRATLTARTRGAAACDLIRSIAHRSPDPRAMIHQSSLGEGDAVRRLRTCDVAIDNKSIVLAGAPAPVRRKTIAPLRTHESSVGGVFAVLIKIFSAIQN